jgi:hypothetical protein
LYCDTPCISYDLPVLHEVGGPGIKFVPLGDYEHFKSALAEVLQNNVKADLKEIVDPTIRFENYAAALDSKIIAVVRKGPRIYKWYDHCLWLWIEILERIGDHICQVRKQFINRIAEYKRANL